MVIGFRSFPEGFTYVILDGTQGTPRLIAKERISLPKYLSWPKSLSWVRRQLAEVIRANKVDAASIKITEPIAKKKSDKRFQIEAIIQECLHSEFGITCSTKIKAQLKKSIKNFSQPARYLETILSNSSELAELNNPAYQEATLAAISELSAE